MKIYDSNQKQLPGPQIMGIAIQNEMEQGVYPGINFGQLMAALAKETTMKGTDIKQIGNTVFIGHFAKEGKDKSRMAGRALNVDTGRNFIDNGEAYFRYLQQAGVKQYFTEFESDRILNAFKVFKRKLENNTDTTMEILPDEDPGEYQVFVEFGEEPIKMN